MLSSHFPLELDIMPKHFPLSAAGIGLVPKPGPTAWRVPQQSRIKQARVCEEPHVQQQRVNAWIPGKSRGGVRAGGERSSPNTFGNAATVRAQHPATR
mmetsp:Transcript_1240/g.2269  ORF Transcript_1240/g.2269 Transcript_1240/m.2269 type:complete len:98 (-) Transcript_1240:549-842(-)